VSSIAVPRVLKTGQNLNLDPMQCSRAVSEVVAMKKAHFKWLPWCTRVDPYLLSCTHACESHYGLFTTPTYTYDTCQAAHIRQRGIF
jgi:hypothetical protein